jgi:hypothetical protein
MVDILVGFLVDGDDMSIAAVSGLDMGSSRFVVHGRLHQMASLIEEKDETSEVCMQYHHTYTTVGHHAVGSWPGHSAMDMSGSGVELQRHAYRQIWMLGPRSSHGGFG